MSPTVGFLLLQLGGVIASSWVQQPIGTTVDFRSVRAINTEVAWASGNKGTFARTVDGGKTWHASFVPAASKCDFRIHALDVDNAVLVSAIPPARVYRTTNGGRVWSLQYEDLTPGVRLKGGAFWNTARGVVCGDPVEGSFLVLTTTDGGGVWRKTSPGRIPPPLPNEVNLRPAAFAIAGSDHAWFGTGGGTQARIFRTTDGGESWTVTPTRFPAGPGRGILSLTFRDPLNGVAVGGNAISRSTNGGATWSVPSPVRAPTAIETVVYVPDSKPMALVGVGRAGSVFSTDGGVSWGALGKDSFDAISFAGPVDAGWGVASEGRIEKFASGVSRSRSLRAGEDTTRLVNQPPVEKPTLGRVEASPTATPAKGASAPKVKRPAVELSN